MKKYSSFLFAATVLFAASCNNASQTASDKSKQDTSAKTTTQAVANDDADLLPNLFQIGAIFKSAELSYASGMTSDIKDISHLNTFYEEAIHMGIYSADLSYVTVNKQKDPVNKYIKVVKDLSDAMGLGMLFSNGNQIAKRFEANMNNDDSVTSIVGDLQVKMDELLSRNKQNNIRVIIYSGAWLESMHIATRIYVKDKNANASNHIVEQVAILENILKVMDKYKSADVHLGALYKDMKAIDDDYNALGSVKNYNPAKDKSLVLKPEDISKLGESVEILRVKILGSNS